MNFFGIGPAELILVLVVALIVFGPGRLPEIGSALGKSIREFRKATSEMTKELTDSMNEVRQPIEEMKQLPVAWQTSAPAEPAPAAADRAPVAVGDHTTEIADHTPVSNTTVCPKCSSPNSQSNKFCGNCGAELTQLGGDADHV